MIPSYDIAKTVAFFIELLGFTVVRDDITYFVLQKDNLTVHILRAGADIGEMEFYMEVDDLEEVWSMVKDKLEGIKTKGPIDREYGMRELHIIVPETRTLLFIGQQTK